MKKHKPHIDRVLEIPSKTEELANVRRFIAQASRDFGFSDDDSMKIEIAVDEACTNIIKHAYTYNPDGWIRITLTEEARNESPNRLVIVITDSGRSFDGTSYAIPDMKEYFKRLKPGGLGIFLMKKIMDEVEYHSLPGRVNSIKLVKYLHPTA